MQPGFCIIHANQLETLAELAISHCAQTPLAPLERETVLVQSNGMADWLKLKQAENTGISASMDFPMPASFLWQMYQQVLSPDLVDAASPFAKDSLQWRILRLLPKQLEQADFALARQFLSADPHGTKTFQLARKMADLFDQYQLYRADWIRGWEQGRLLNLGPHETWQAALWRAIVASLADADKHRSRAHLHAAFLQALESKETPPGLPRRIVLFGISTLPKQLLEALYALSSHSQLLLMVLSPCREYWGERGQPLVDDETFAATNPLLDSWGSQGRDFLNLLQNYTPTEIALQHTQEIDPYADAAAHTRRDSILCELQQAMLDNRLPDANQTLPASPGLGFYPAYSAQREVEVLHDQLLALFARDKALRYQDVIIMTPDIDRYAPHIEAAFNRYPANDPRHLAFSVSDRLDNSSPLYNAIEYLLNLPQQRLTFSEVIGLVQQSAIQRASGIGEDDIDQLHDWAAATHIRWALDSDHKQQLLELPTETPQDWRQHNTWRAGLDQLLAGYCVGSAPIFSTIAVDEVSANRGAILGKLVTFTDHINQYQNQLAMAKTPGDWAATFTQLLATFFDPANDDDRLLLDQMNNALRHWLADCELAGFDNTLPLAHARQGWFDHITQASLRQRLNFDGITFCTLMPMRALPFKHIFLLGMNDDDYPHQQPQFDFDLMQHDYRSGDRDRRQDDHYLFLEALMSVRDSLHVSWVGRDIRNNEPRQPSVLVSQLRDLVDRCWITDQVDENEKPVNASTALTRQSPLAAFSRRYFEPENTPIVGWPYQQPARTYATEWFGLYDTPDVDADPSLTVTGDNAPDALTVRQLATVLKAPAEVFYSERLQIRFEMPEESAEDNEPFSLTGLEKWHLRHDLLQSLLHDEPPATQRWQNSGALPPGTFAEPVLDEELRAARSIKQRFHDNLDHTQRRAAVELTLDLFANGNVGTLDVLLDNVWQTGDELVLASTSASNLIKEKHYRYDKLAPIWVRHLAANAHGLAAHSIIVSRDKQIRFTPIAADTAHAQLNRLYLLYRLAWIRPLPLEADKISPAKEPEATIGSLTGDALNKALENHWPVKDMDKDSTAFFTELLYRPMKQAIEGGAQ